MFSLKLQVVATGVQPDEVFRRRARCYIVWMFGGLLFVEASKNSIPLYLLRFLTDEVECARYSWGSATLALLYRQMCLGALGTKGVRGCFLLLQLRAWKRIATVRPVLSAEQPHCMGGGGLGRKN